MKKIIKPLLLTAATLVAGVLIVFCAALLWIKSTHGLEWVQSRINTAIPGELRIDRHRFSFLKPSLDLYDGVLIDPRGLTIIGFSRFSVEIDWWTLWRREIQLKNLLLQAPRVDLAVNEDARLNLIAALVPPDREKQAKTPDGPGLPFNIVIKSLQLTEGRFSFAPAGGTTRLETTGINLAANGDLEARSGNVDLTIAKVLFRSAGIHPQPARIALKTRLNGDELVISAVDLTSGQTRLTLSGVVDDLFTAPMLDSDLSIDGQLADLKTAFDLDGDYSGPVNATLTLKGSVTNPDAGLVLTVDGGRIAGQPLDRGDISINLHDRQASIDTATVQLAKGTISVNGTVNLREAFPKSLLTPPDNVDAIAYTLTVVQDIPELNPWLKRFVDLGGRVTSRLTLSGTGVSPAGMSAALTLDGSGKDLLAPGMEQPLKADVTLAAQLKRGKISISRLNTVADGFDFSADGYYRLDDQTLAGNLSLTSEDLSHALAVAGIPFVHGACNAAISIKGSLNQPQFSANLFTEDLKIDAYTLGNVSIKANMDPDGQLQLTHLTLKNKETLIRGNGQLRLLSAVGGIDPNYINALDLSLEKLSAANFMASPPINGTLDGRLQVGGPLKLLKGALSLKGRALKVDAATIGDVDANIRLNDGNVVVDRLHLQNQNSTITATGNIQLLTPGTLRPLEYPTFKFSAGSDHFDPGHFVDAASGNFTFNAESTGSLDKMAGQVSLTGSQASLAGQPIESISLDAHFDEKRFWLDRIIAAVAPDEHIEGSGWIGLDKTVDLHLKSTGIATSNIYGVSEYFPGEGNLRVDMSAQGSIENPDIDGRLTVSDITFEDGTIDDIDLAVSLHDMQATAKGNLNFEIDAACDLKKGDFIANLTFDRTETATYFKAAGKPGFHGTLTGRVQAAGNIRDIGKTSAQVDMSALHLMFEEISLVQSDKIALQLADRDLSISDFDMAILTEGHLRLQGDARIGGPLDMAVDGRIPLAAAGVLSDVLTDATGVIALVGDISGEYTAPQFDAHVNLENIGMAVPGLVQQLRNLNGSINLTQDKISVDKIEGLIGTGTFAVNGTIDHNRFEPVGIDLGIIARSVPLEVPDTLAVRVNADIQIKGENRAANARGEIILLEGVYDKDVNISLLQIASTATTRQRTVAPATKPVTIPYFETVNLNIVIGYRQPFAVQNNLAQLDISPDLKIGGSLANPIISGRAQVRDGTVTFQKRDFDVKKGIIDFVNPYRTEAEIDIESEAEIRTWKINLAVKGTLDNLDIRLSSVPTETEADILSLILFGRTARELTAAEGGSQRTTGQIMADMLADTFGDDIKKRSGVDILELETTDGSDGQDTGGIKVTVGKHLSDRMTVKYAIETIKGETQQKAIMEYKLLERILVNGSQSTNGLFGAELVYRIEFR